MKISQLHSKIKGFCINSSYLDTNFNFFLSNSTTTVQYNTVYTYNMQHM